MQFDKNQLFEKYNNKDLFAIISELSAEVTYLDNLYCNIKRHKDISEDQLLEYRKYAVDFLFFLNTEKTPSGIGIEGLRNFLPVITNLVGKGLEKSALAIFK